VDRKLKEERTDQFYRRDLGEPVVFGKALRRVQPLLHNQRLILLDVVVRSYISDPAIEYFSDDTVRYNIEAALSAITNTVRYDVNLRMYLHRSAGSWLHLLSPICVNCGMAYAHHAKEKCLFSPTVWKAFAVPDDRIRELSASY